MHKSRLAGFIIDCQTGDLAGAARFWSAALGMPMEEFPGAEGKIYTGLQAPELGLHIEVQKVDHPSRVHLDIATDDIPAEVARLEALGARRLGAVKRWVVMEAPTGQRFCVVSDRNVPGFERTANEWR
jgi:predicted enzyme related to lactoylglutathione lyase